MDLEKAQELYANVRYCQGAFDHSHKLKTKDLVTCAHNFLTELRKYEETVNAGTRFMLGGFIDPKNLASEVVREDILVHRD